MKIYVDFDNTLVKTRHLKPYLHTKEGREYLINNPGAVKTELVNPKLPGFLNNIKDHVVIVTNSPARYAQAMLKLHGFPEVDVRGDSKKPCGYFRTEPASLVIGDEPSDIFFAHEHGLANISYREGSYYPEDNIERSTPSVIANNLSELEKLITQRIPYIPKTTPKHFVLDKIKLEDIPIHHIREYYKWGSKEFYSSDSKVVLAIKKMKNFTWPEICNGARDRYFNRGQLNADLDFGKNINTLYAKVVEKIKSLNLIGTTQIIALPNSLPEYGYLCDPNNMIARTFNKNKNDRLMIRIKPVADAHSSGERNLYKNVNTLALSLESDPNFISFYNADKIILFDDVTTSGNQMRAAAALLRNSGYKNQIIGLAIGKTTQPAAIISPPTPE